MNASSTAAAAGAIQILSPSTNIGSNNSNHNTLSILSYNILYKDWVSTDRYPWLSNADAISWKYRLPKIRGTIAKYHADIVCLQEVDIDEQAFRQEFGDYFRADYNAVLPPCTTVKLKKRESDGHWGCAVLYDRTRFQLISKEFLKKSAREMVLLFTDIAHRNACAHCNNNNDNNNTICCVYHSFFVVNVHLAGHPAKWRARLNACQRIIAKLKLFGSRFNSPKIEKKTLKLNTNIRGNWRNMRIFICGDFNAPKLGNVDRTLINGAVDIRHYNITHTFRADINAMNASVPIEDEEKQVDNCKLIRFAVDAKRVGAIIGDKGARIEGIREQSNASVWIKDASKGKYGLNTLRLVGVKGTQVTIAAAIELCIDYLHAELPAHVRRDSVFILMEQANLDNAACAMTADIEAQCHVSVNVYGKPLCGSSEQPVQINGDVDAIKRAIRVLIDRWFENPNCVDTQTLYHPDTEFDANFNHGFAFRDCYDEALQSMGAVAADAVADDEADGAESKANAAMDSYYDRIKYFPTFGDGVTVGSMDFIYYTANNMKLLSVTKTLDDDALLQKIQTEVDRIRTQPTATHMHKQQALLSNVLHMPSETFVSDHLPIAAVFQLPDIEHGMDGSDDARCDCVQHPNAQRLRSKINKNPKKKRKYVQKSPVADDTI